MLIDLKYGATYRVFDHLQSDNFLSQTDLIVLDDFSHTPQNHDDALTIWHPLPSEGIRENIFRDPRTGDSTLKRKTNYFKLVLGKCKP